MGEIKIQRTKLSKHPPCKQPKCLVNIWIRCWRSTNSGLARASGSLEAVAESSPRCPGPFVCTWGYHKRRHHHLCISVVFFFFFPQFTTMVTPCPSTTDVWTLFPGVQGPFPCWVIIPVFSHIWRTLDPRLPKAASFSEGLIPWKSRRRHDYKIETMIMQWSSFQGMLLIK